MCSVYFMSFAKSLRQPGIEPGTTAWKAAMLTITPLTLLSYHMSEATCQKAQNCITFIIKL